MFPEWEEKAEDFTAEHCAGFLLPVNAEPQRAKHMGREA